MKVMNPEYKRLRTVPMDIQIRQEIGSSIKPEDAGTVEHKVGQLLRDKEKYKEKINDIVKRSLYNRGKSGAAGGQYILDALVWKRKEKTKTSPRNTL